MFKVRMHHALTFFPMPFPGMPFGLDIFKTPVTVTPQQEILKTVNSSKIP